MMVFTSLKARLKLNRGDTTRAGGINRHQQTGNGTLQSGVGNQANNSHNTYSGAQSGNNNHGGGDQNIYGGGDISPMYAQHATNPIGTQINNAPHATTYHHYDQERAVITTGHNNVLASGRARMSNSANDARNGSIDDYRGSRQGNGNRNRRHSSDNDDSSDSDDYDSNDSSDKGGGGGSRQPQSNRDSRDRRNNDRDCNDCDNRNNRHRDDRHDAYDRDGRRRSDTHGNGNGNSNGNGSGKGRERRFNDNGNRNGGKRR